MTIEQEKAIKVLEQYKRECIEEYKVELDDKDNIDQPRVFYLHQQIESVYIVLNMLKEKDAEIEKYKQLYNKALDDAVITAHDNMKKDKMIDLMAEKIGDISSNSYCNSTKECTEQECKNCIKQYFERKVKDERI